MKLEYTNQTADPITGARSLTPACASALLNRLVSQTKERIVMFDLDSTLLDNRARNAKIMQQFGELNNEPLLLNAKPSHWQDWSARNAMKAMGLPHSDIDMYLDPYDAFWLERFFTSAYCQYDTEVAGAVRFVTNLQQAGGKIRYLTGRHEGMRTGTLDSLHQLGFPMPESGDVSLIMKSEQSIPDDTYKKNELAQLSRKFDILAAFDNEPFHINAYRTAFPEATCIHLNTDHSMREVRLMGGIVSINDFTH